MVKYSLLDYPKSWELKRCLFGKNEFFIATLFEGGELYSFEVDLNLCRVWTKIHQFLTLHPTIQIPDVYLHRLSGKGLSELYQLLMLTL